MGKDGAGHLRVVLPFMAKALRYLPSTAGFSLLEMIVVLVIIGIAAALLAPAVGSSLENVKFRSLARDISASLRYARNQAVANKVDFEVSFDPDKNRYTIAPQRVEGADAIVEQEGLGQASEAHDDQLWLPKHKVLPRGILLRTENGLQKRIVFYPRGNSTGGTIEIERAKGDKLLIVVDRVTGRVKVTVPEGS